MEKKFKLGVIGAGFMSTAIVQGVINGGSIDANAIIVSDVNKLALDRASLLGVSVTNDNRYLVENAEFVLFAVKPQSLTEVLSQIKGASCDKFVSIMAGVKKSKIKTVFPNAKVCRCMPNTPCSIGSGAVGLDDSDFTDKKDLDFIKSLFHPLATVVSVPENKLNAVTGVSGSSPAYFYLFLKGIVNAGIEQGLAEKDALTLAVNTMIGSGKMVLKNVDKSLDELINAVCSKGGTTIEAIKVYEELGLTDITSKAVDACVKRSAELENLL